MVNFAIGQKEQVEKLVKDAAPIKIEINLSKLTEMFSKAEQAIDSMIEQAEKHAITDSDTQSKAIEMGTQAKQLFNRLEKKRKEIKEPFLKYGQQLDGMVKPLKDKLAGIQTGLKIKIKKHLDEEERLAAEKEKKRLELEAALNPQKSPDELVPETPAPVIQSKQKTSSGSMATKKVWKFEIEDVNKVPARYLMVNESAIKAAIDNGARDIPGVKIYKDRDVRLTVARKGGPFNG